MCPKIALSHGLYGLGETNEAGEQLEDFCLEHQLALANTVFKQHLRRLYTWTCPDGNCSPYACSATFFYFGQPIS